MLPCPRPHSHTYDKSSAWRPEPSDVFYLINSPLTSCNLLRLPWTRFGFSGSKLFIWNILAKISPSSPGRIVRDLIWSYLTFCLSRDWYERFQDCPLNNRKSSDIAGLVTGYRYKSLYAAHLTWIWLAGVVVGKLWPGHHNVQISCKTKKLHFLHGDF